MSTTIPLLSTLVSLVFALTLLDQYLSRRRPYQIVWTGGLVVFAAATFSEFAFWAFGPSEAAYKAWYFFGAMLAAAYLGMGSCYLHLGRRLAHGLMGLLGLSTLAAAGLIIAAPVDGGALMRMTVLSGEALAVVPVRFPLTAVLNTFGSAALIAGAIYSAWNVWRRRAPTYQLVSNLLIAAGALVTAGSGVLARFGLPSPLSLATLLGITIIFLGFLRSREVFGFYRFPPLLYRLRPGT